MESKLYEAFVDTLMNADFFTNYGHSTDARHTNTIEMLLEGTNG